MRSKRARRAAWGLALALSLVAGGACAQSVLRPGPKASAAGNRAQCSIQNAFAIDFGDYLPGQATTLNGAGSVMVRCNQGNTPLTLSAGPSFTTGSITYRALRHAGGRDELRYQLYLDSAHVTIWGDGVNGGRPFQRVVNPQPQTFTYYGAIAAGQSVASGDYVDRITILVMP